MATSWSFDTKAKRYRDGKTGRFLPKRDVVAIRDRVVDAAGQEARNIAQRAVRGEITPDQLRQQLRVVVRNAHVAEYLYGRGGVSSMTSADFGRLGQTLRQAYARLETLIGDVSAGVALEAQAANRASMATDGATLSFERAQAAAWGISGQLPVMPADGGTKCLTRCRCRWDIRETETTVDAYWRLSAGESCPDCKVRAARYSPYSMPRYVAQPETAPVRLAAIRRVA